MELQWNISAWGLVWEKFLCSVLVFAYAVTSFTSSQDLHLKWIDDNAEVSRCNGNSFYGHCVGVVSETTFDVSVFSWSLKSSTSHCYRFFSPFLGKIGIIQNVVINSFFCLFCFEIFIVRTQKLQFENERSRKYVQFHDCIIIANSLLSISSYIVVTLSYGYEMKVHRY